MVFHCQQSRLFTVELPSLVNKVYFDKSLEYVLFILVFNFYEKFPDAVLSYPKPGNMLVYNKNKEALLATRLVHLSHFDDKVSVVSEDGVRFPVSRQLFSFFTGHLTEGCDAILAPVSSQALAAIVHGVFVRPGEMHDKFEFSEEAKTLGMEVKNNFVVEGNNDEETVETGELIMHQLKVKNFNQSASLKSENLKDIERVNHKNTESNKVIKLKENQEERIHTIVTTASKKTEDEDVSFSSDSGNNKKIKLFRKMGRPSFRKVLRGDPIIEWTYNEDGTKIPTNLTCQVCGKLFKVNTARMRKWTHAYNKHFDGHDMDMICGCDLKLVTANSRRIHFRVVHQGYVQCKLCHEVFASEKKLESHTSSFHIKCDICPFMSRSGTYGMKQHSKAHYNMETRQLKSKESGFKCEDAECDKVFHDKGSRNAHFQRVHVIKECHLCGVKVKQLKQHNDSVHRSDSEKLFHCDQCGKGFSVKHTLSEHVKVDHEGLRYHCRYSNCDKKDQEYRDSSNRLAHERKRHGGVWKETK